VSPSPLSEPLATDRLNTPKSSQTETESISACRIYCAAYETSQGDRSNRFSAIADLLIIGGDDFFDLSGVLQSGHGCFVRHRFFVCYFVSREATQRTKARRL
jgi:hypothetical protein